MNNKSISKQKNKIISRKQRILKRKILFRRLFLILFTFSALFLIGFGIYFSANKIFCIKNIILEGNNLYTNAEILDNSNIHYGDGLIFLNVSKIEKNIYKSFSKIDEVKVYKNYPGTIKINLKTVEPKFCIKQEDGFYIISCGDRLIEITLETPAELVIISGVEFFIDDIGKFTYVNQEKGNMIDKIMSSITQMNLNLIREIDVSNINGVTMNYDGRINVLFGTDVEFDYKMTTLKEIIDNKINAGERGTLDLRELSHENRSYFIPKSS